MQIIQLQIHFLKNLMSTGKKKNYLSIKFLMLMRPLCTGNASQLKHQHRKKREILGFKTSKQRITVLCKCFYNIHVETPCYRKV